MIKEVEGLYLWVLDKIKEIEDQDLREYEDYMNGYLEALRDVRDAMEAGK